MNEYINKDGSIIEGAPSEIYTFMNVFGQYKEQLRNLDPAKYDTFIKEYNEYKRKRNNNESISSDMFTLKGDEFEAYEGAIVLEPKCNLYLDMPVACVDYSSLYPSVSISENFSMDSKVGTIEYNIDGTIKKKNGDLFFIDCQCVKVRDEK